MKKNSFLLLLLFTMILAAGCVREEQKMKLAFGELDRKDLVYPKVETGDLELKMLSKPIIHAGDDGDLTFAIINHGRKQVEIKEWLAHEPDNLIIHIQPRLTKMTEPDPDSWISLTFNPKQPVWHRNLILMPSNHVLVTKKLNFIRNLSLAPHTERRYYLKAETTLKSLKMSTPLIELRVLPNQLIIDR